MPARYRTPRTPGRATDGAAGAFVAHLHGRQWLAWQREAADLIGEQLANGRYAYPVVVILVPRQCGKTTFVFDLLQGRCLQRPGFEAAYTAQTGQLASERFKDRMTALAQNPLGTVLDTYRSTGKERITNRRNLSYLKAFPPIAGALRGSANDCVVVDEAQEVTEDQGRDLDQQIIPTFNTKPARQLILIGTAGTDASGYLLRYLDLARSGTTGFALVEYGWGPEDDATSERVWRATHPGLAGGLTDTDALRAALATMGESAFAREFGNVWQSSASRVIPDPVWRAAATPLARPAPAAAVAFGADIAFDRRAASITAAWPDDVTGRPVLELVRHGPGTLWVAGELERLRARHPGCTVWVPRDGPAGTLIDDLERGELPHVSLTTREYAAACAALYDGLTADPPTVTHHADAALDLAVAHAARRPHGEGWSWGRRISGADISPLTAGTVALHGFRRPPLPPRPRPAVYSA